MSVTNVPLTALAILATAALVINNRRKRSEGPPLPPGPPALPLVGNVTGIDTEAPWLSYTKWGLEYGDLLYTRLFSQHIIVINSEKVAREVMEQRSHIYSDRPVIATTEPLGMGFNSVLKPYGPGWRHHRRLIHQAVRPDAAFKYRPLQLEKTHELLLNILTTPENYLDHLQSGSTILSAIYGYDATTCEDPFLVVIDKATKIITEDLRPEVAAILSAFPFLLRFPSWFPGMQINARAAEARGYAKEWVESTFQYTWKALAAGTNAPSMIADALRKIDDQDGTSELTGAVKDVAATMFLAGSETTQSTLRIFILAMILYPATQERAQALIDSVVGKDRLPNFDDREALSYIDAVVRETLRWRPAFPLGSVPHATTEDDLYNGYLIPKGSTIIPNVWAMAHDETKYHNAMEFIPERFLNDDGSLTDDKAEYSFGFGRRGCAGKYMADAALWASVALLLAVFKFSKAKDADGNDIEIDGKMSSGLTIHPIPFPCSITPRSPDMTVEKLTELIQASG
ncbi:cytochrome P450 [Hygrophoropsis aurantiaca]|uniref:Cytochrome P450 n=1 Tax=Hygrophoropsis aurantiaca TaxID=72124 RepID=A0ACB8AF11_9AGAM|nr:cytochrome P450 [Hygrophoropsis aurantiaca]